MPARLAAALLAALFLAAAGCGGNGGSDTTAGTSQNAAPAGTAAGSDDGGGGGASDAGPSNPCDAVTEAQWEAIFGSGVTKADASGSRNRCSVLTSGSSSGQEIALQELGSMGIASFDDALASYTGCSGEPTEIDLADRAVLDTSCLPTSGKAWVIAQSGEEVLYVSLNLGGPASGDPAAIGDAFAEAATAIVDAR